MSELVLHPHTRLSIDDFIAHPTHAVLLVGAAGIGKSSLAYEAAAKILSIEPEKLTSYPYTTFIRPEKERSISIDALRQLERFMSLRVPGGAQRIAIVEDAHYLTTEAQNAFLKTLEEPPTGTTVILTTASEQALLPTIRSRVQSIAVKRPKVEELVAHFAKEYAAERVQQAVLMSGGLPGLMHALLSENAEHPLIRAAKTARQLLQQSTFERLAMVDALAKQREECLNILTILQQMAHMALHQTASKSQTQAKSWQRILAASYQANEALLLNTQTKLVLTDLMLNL
jgi:hypothetical protein